MSLRVPLLALGAAAAAGALVWLLAAFWWVLVAAAALVAVLAVAARVLARGAVVYWPSWQKLADRPQDAAVVETLAAVPAEVAQERDWWQ